VRRSVVLLLLFAATPAAAAPDPAAPPAARTLGELERAVLEAEARLSQLVARARVDFRAERVRMYREMTPQQLADPLRGVTVEELLRYVADEEAPPTLREEAAAAIGIDVARRVDPDLADEGRGMKRPRASFSGKILPLLTDAKDLHARSLADGILDRLWPGMDSREPEITAYDPRKKDTWWPARRAWEKQLKR
jgi:hypothetical protein